MAVNGESKDPSGATVKEAGSEAGAAAAAATTTTTAASDNVGEILRENGASGEASQSDGGTREPGGDGKPDFVETTLRRYLQRGLETGGSSGGDGNEERSGDGASDNATASDEHHKHGIRRLATMVRELVVLIDAINVGSFATGKEEEVVATSNKIRSGVTDTVLEMNRIALEQLEEWTRRWVEANPLMEAPGEEDIVDDSEEQKHDGLHNWFGNAISYNQEGRPVNFRRRVLDNLPADSRQLYEILEGRLSVDRDDWYGSFGGSVEDFSVGVWTLRKCGLIRPKKTKTRATATNNSPRGNAKRRKDTISYEKVAVVWC